MTTTEDQMAKQGVKEQEFLSFVQTKQLFKARKGKANDQAVYIPMKVIREKFFNYPRDTLCYA